MVLEVNLDNKSWVLDKGHAFIKKVVIFIVFGCQFIKKWIAGQNLVKLMFTLINEVITNP